METFSLTGRKEAGGRRESEMKQDSSLGAESDVETFAIQLPQMAGYRNSIAFFHPRRLLHPPTGC